MGYYSDYSLRIFTADGSRLTDADTDTIIRELNEIASAQFQGEDAGGNWFELTLYGVKWYEHAEDLARLTEKFPVRVRLLAVGEDNIEWAVYAEKGKTVLIERGRWNPPRWIDPSVGDV